MKFSRGFTLIELVVVMVIIGILATISFVTYRGIQEQAQTAAINTAVDQWSKVIGLQLMNGTLPTDNAGGTSCLGVSAADFPAENGFAAGKCIDYENVGSLTPAQLDEAALGYDDVFFNTSSWWSNQSGRFNGKTATNKVTFSSGGVFRMRGVIASLEPSHTNGFYWGHEPRIALQWMVASEKISCGKGADATADYIAALGSMLPPGTTALTGKMCRLTIPY